MTVFAPALGYYWKSAQAIGLDPDALFRKAGIDPRLRQDISARVSAKQVDDLIWMAKQESRDDSFAFQVVKNIHPSYLGALGFAWMTSASLRKAFQRLARYYRLLTEDVEIRLEDPDNDLLVTFVPQSSECNDPALRERLRVAGAVQMCRMVCGENFSPTYVHFQQPAPRNASDYYEFFRCEQVFGQDATRMCIDEVTADADLPGFNPQIVQQFDHMTIDYLARMDRSDILGSVRASILEQLPSGDASLEATAASLGQSPRSLSRKLQEKGESFKHLLAGIRKELAEKYIRDRSLTLTEISYLLGFAETSSFSRAYRNWTGKAPSTHRSELFESA